MLTSLFKFIVSSCGKTDINIVFPFFKYFAKLIS